MSMRTEFVVTPPDLAKAWIVPGLAFAAVVGVMVYAAQQRQTGAWLGLVGVGIGVALVASALRRRKVVLEDGALAVAAGFNSTRVPVAALDIAHARVVDLDEHDELRPGLKSFGTSMPGYQAGHFRRLDGQKSFALLTDRRRVLVLPERGGRRLLLSLERPQDLLDRLREADR